MHIDEIMKKLLIIDGHTDIPRHLYLRHLEGNSEAFLNEHYPALKRSQVNIVVVNVFTKGKKEETMEQAMFQIERILDAAENIGDIVLIKSRQDLKDAVENKKLGLILSLEGFEPLGNSLNLLNLYYHLGVRAGMLTWNWANAFASGTDTNEPLSIMGVEALEKMHELGIVVDVSHLNEKGFWDVISKSQKPIIASHSNARALFNHPRNLYDEQIIAIANTGGVIGTTPYFTKVNQDNPSKFRTDDDSTETVEDFIQHIEYIINLVGYDHVAFGFDFNLYLGDFGVKGIEDTEKIKNVISLLIERGHRIEDIEKIAGLNLLRVFNQILK